MHLVLEFVGDDGGDGGDLEDSVESFAVDEKRGGSFDAGNFAFLLFGVDAGCLILTSNQSVTGFTQVTEAFTIHGQFGLKF